MVFALSEFVRYLVFPFVLLVAGAWVTGVVIPWGARRRDRHMKALEIKTDLVTEISETVLNFVMAMEFEVLDDAEEEPTYEQAYRKWEVKSGVLHTKLETYFDRPDIEMDWKRLEDHLRTAHADIGDKGETAASWRCTKNAALDLKQTLITNVRKARVADIEPESLRRALRL